MKKLFFPLVIISLSVLLTASDDRMKTIVFFGDSITAGYGLSKEQAYPAIFNKQLKKKGYQYEVVNSGLSGETSAGGLSRVNWVLKKPVDIFVLELGANDALRGLPLIETKKNLQGIIDKVKSKYPNTKIVIAGMMAPPNLGREYATSFARIFPELAKENKAILVPFILAGVAGDKSLNLPDGIHPNVEGHYILADNVMDVVKGIL